MLHLRVVCPAAKADQVLDSLRDEPGAVHLVHLPGASLRPEGDLIEADVARESTERVLEHLTDLGVNRSGGVSLESVDTMLSDTADAAERAVPGEGADAIIWDELVARTGEESQLNGIFVAFLTIACLLATAGVITDSVITIVGAMIVGPEFGPLSALAVALLGKRWALARQAGVALGVGFLVAMLITAALTFVAQTVGLFEPTELSHLQRLAFIYQVGPFSVVIALLAGAAGMLALTSSKSSALVGVFVSVTTVPAAGLAVAAAIAGHWIQCGGSLLQLVVNLIGMTVAGTVVLLIRRGPTLLVSDARRGVGSTPGRG
ncbi:MAG: DUF389 domain-containing protein [Nocardioidaceae bacterium]